LFKKLFIRKSKINSYKEITKEILNVNNFGIVWLYKHLENRDSKQLLIDIIAYRILGHRYVKLLVNNQDYWNSINTIGNLSDKKQIIPIKFLGWQLKLFDVSKIGYKLNMFNTLSGITSTFLLEQYAYKSVFKTIEANPGDNVIDAGGCWGDTSLYFATKVGKTGRVFSFEFIPGNLEIFVKNISLNPGYDQNLTIVKRPLWEVDGKKVFYLDNGPGSKVSFDKIDNADGVTETITIDKYVEDNNIVKIDFIKMDIEGAELFALKGASNTINRFSPQLAISIYHNLNDFTEIPRWINNLNMGYILFLGHYSIHSEETVLFATNKRINV
jgi:FkbM family methyltransferase